MGDYDLIRLHIRNKLMVIYQISYHLFNYDEMFNIF